MDDQGKSVPGTEENLTVNAELIAIMREIADHVKRGSAALSYACKAQCEALDHARKMQDQMIQHPPGPPQPPGPKPPWEVEPY